MISRVLAIVVFATLVSANATLIDFDSSDGGFTSSTVQNVGGGGTPWTYFASSAVCAGGSGGCWTVADYLNISDQRLISPVFAATGDTNLLFDHAFNLERGSNFYDGGVVEISINGGAFTDVTSLYQPQWRMATDDSVFAGRPKWLAA